MSTELQRLCAENAAMWAAAPDLMAIAAALTDGPEASPADYLPAQTRFCRECRHPEDSHGGDDGSPECWEPIGPSSNVVTAAGHINVVTPVCPCPGFVPMIAAVPDAG